MRSLDLPWLGHWVKAHRRWLAGWLIVVAVAKLLDDTSTVVMGITAALAPAAVGMVWRGFAPAGYERWCGGPARRFGWRRHVRRRWLAIADRCGLTATVPTKTRSRKDGQADYRLVAPKLQRVRTRGHLLELTVRTRAGQTVDDLEAAVPRLASTLSAVSYRTRPVSGGASGCTAVIELVMADHLTTATTAVEPEPWAVAEKVFLGNTQGGQKWELQIRGRHTLVAGCSGAGKGSVLWGICCGLAPAVRADVVRLWGVDLKRGVELEMGAGLFSAHAYTPDDALPVLRALRDVIDDRGRSMAGTTRLHQPTVGDPLHVLVIDELAALTAYADITIRREAERLLSEILTQGRALGVVVVACVQDPRKDVVTMRGLFTQTVALRLRSPEETSMVLGEGMTKAAPAHRISPTYPGTAWVVEDNGAADRVRADYWPDDLIRTLSRRWATEVHVDTSQYATPAKDAVDLDAFDLPRAPRPRSPRKPRKKAPAEATAAPDQGAA